MPSEHLVSPRTRQLRHLSALAAHRFRTAILAAERALEAEEQKVNPNHDELGRFTTGAGGSAAGAAEAAARQARRDRLVAAQDKAMTDPALRRSDPTHCNQATVQILEAVGAPVQDLTDAQGRALSANAMADALARSKDWIEVTRADAIRLADNGNPVTGAWKNPGNSPNDPHGHLGSLRPGGLPGEPQSTSGNPVYANIAGGKTGVRRESQVLGPEKRKNVRYYTPLLRPKLPL